MLHKCTVQTYKLSFNIYGTCCTFEISRDLHCQDCFWNALHHMTHVSYHISRMHIYQGSKPSSLLRKPRVPESWEQEGHGLATTSSSNANDVLAVMQQNQCQPLMSNATTDATATSWEFQVPPCPALPRARNTSGWDWAWQSPSVEPVNGLPFTTGSYGSRIENKLFGKIAPFCKRNLDWGHLWSLYVRYCLKWQVDNRVHVHLQDALIFLSKPRSQLRMVLWSTLLKT